MKYLIALIIPALMLLPACEESGNQPSSDQVQAQQQEQLTAEGTRQTGMPAIKNFRERKMLKDILELRDQAGLVTYTYIVSEMTGRLRFFGETIGYGIPYATQYTTRRRSPVSSTDKAPEPSPPCLRQIPTACSPHPRQREPGC